MNHGRSRFRWLGILLLVVSLVAAACGGDDDDEGKGSDTTKAPGGATTKVDAPGVTDTEIRFASFGTNSNNPLGTCVLDCYDDGIKAYFAYRNSEGGVHGRKLVLSKELDDELGKNKDRALEIISANDVFGAFSATQIASGWADIAEAGIPLWTWSIHPEGQNKDNVWGYLGATCYDCTGRFVPWTIKHAKATKVASLGYGVSQNSKLCAQGLKNSLELYNDDIGASVVYLNDELPFGLANGVAPEVTAMKKAGVDFVSTCIDLNGAKTFAQEMARQGMGDVPIYHPNTYNQQFVKDAGDLFVGDYIGVAFRPFEGKNNEALANFKKWMDKEGAELTEIAMIGWLNAELAYEGIEAAGENFDRDKVVAATNKLTAWSGEGLINPVDWTRQHQPPTQDDIATHGPAKDCFVIVQVNEDSDLEVVGDPAKPWKCWPGDTREWSEPVETNFD